MSDIKSRLKQVAEDKGYSVRAFEELCGLTRGNISNIVPGGAIGSDKLAKIFDAIPELNPTWLISGVGDMYAQTVQPQQNQDGLTGMAEIFYNKTLEQAEIIGKLRERIKDLERRLEKTVGDANTSHTANVG